MSIPVVNGHTLLPHKANFRSGMRGSRRWWTNVNQVVNGSEERTTLLQAPYHELSFTLLSLQHKERAEMEDRIRAAIKAGTVAVPFWGRGARLTQAYQSGVTQIEVETLWSWAVDDWLIAFQRGIAPEVVYDVIQITAVGAGNPKTLDLASATTFRLGQDQIVYPVLYGEIRVDEQELHTNHHGEINLTVREPTGEGTLGQSSCPALDEPDTPAGTDVCGGEVVLSIQDSDQCSINRTIEWTRAFGADSYIVRRGTISGGPYSDVVTVDADATREYTDQIPVMNGGWFYVVVPVIGGKEGDLSNEIYIADNTLERQMRATQERYFVAFGTYWDWPDRTTPSPVDTPDYPPDGWYEDDIAGGGTSREVFLIQSVMDAFQQFDGVANSDFYELYSTLTNLEEWNPDDPIPMWDKTQDPFNIIPRTVTSGNRQDTLNQILRMNCALEHLWVRPVSPFPISEARLTNWFTLEDTCEDARGKAYDNFLSTSNSWGAYDPGGPGGTIQITSSVQVTPSTGEDWTATVYSHRWNFGANLTQYNELGAEPNVKIYMALEGPSLDTGDPEEWPFVRTISGATPGGIQVDHRFHLVEDVGAQTGAYTTDLYGGGTPKRPVCNEITGWYLVIFDVGLGNEYAGRFWITKSNKPSEGHWANYP